MSQHSNATRPDRRRFAFVTMVLLLSMWAAILSRPAMALTVSGTVRQASFTLDSVPLTLRTSFLPGAVFTTSRPGDGEQVASSAAFAPYRELSVVVVPYGTRSVAEGLPVAAHGGAAGYLNELAAYRHSQGATTAPAPAIGLFGSAVAGILSTTAVPVRATTSRPTAIAEWVAEAGSRLWIVRASRELGLGETQSGLAQAVAGTTLAAAAAMGRTTVVSRAPAAPVAGRVAPEATSDFPSWWSGTCDSGNDPGSFPLGASYLGMPACGPLPGSGGMLVNFFPGAWGEFEWQCVELSMRYLYLTFGQAPYSANGKDVVGNYPGTVLTKVSNGTVGSAPVPGDVISYGPATQFGHTSVVSAASVDGNGNGSVTVVEQNNSANGSNTLTVSGWTVSGPPYPISGWLHTPGTALTQLVNLLIADRGRTEFATWRSSNSDWYIRNGSAAIPWGAQTDIPIPADYDGTGKTEVAVWRPSTGEWFVNGSMRAKWGQSGDIPLPADYDGVGHAQLAVWRPSNGNWYVYGDNANGIPWGQSGDVPLPADYDRVGHAQLAVWRPSNGNWYVIGDNANGIPWGQSGDVPAPGDYDRVGHAQLTVWRPSNGTWYVIGDSANGIQWGQSGDWPVPGDYDRVGHAQLAVWRPSNGNWYVIGDPPSGVQWGMSTDTPVRGHYDG